MKIVFNKTMMDIQWAFISTITASLAHFILRLILGIDLGAEGLGIYTLAFSIYSFGLQFAAFGIGTALTKFVAEYADNVPIIRKYISLGFVSSVVSGTLVGICIFIMSPIIANSLFHTPDLEMMIKLTAFSCPFIGIQKAVIGALNGLRRMKLYAYINIIQNIFIVLITIILVLVMDLGVIGSVVGFVGPTIIMGIICIFIMRNYWISPNINDNFKLFYSINSFSFYIGLGSAVGFIITQIDSILIGYYLNTTEVGIYAIAILFVQTLTLLPSAVQRVTAPATAKMFGKGEIANLKILLYSTLKKSIIVTIICSMLIIIFSPYIISFLFTDEYLEAYIPLLILIIGYSFGASFGSIGATLSSIGKVRIALYIGVVCGIADIFLNTILIPSFGMNGAALATTITMGLNFSLTIIVIKKNV